MEKINKDNNIHLLVGQKAHERLLGMVGLWLICCCVLYLSVGDRNWIPAYLACVGGYKDIVHCVLMKAPWQ